MVLLAVFFQVEARTDSPLTNVRIFGKQAFLAENIILGIAMMAFIPVSFFAAVYGQIAPAEKATTASLLILYFFCGFLVCAQIGVAWPAAGHVQAPAAERSALGDQHTGG